MTAEEFIAKFPKAQKAAVPVKDYNTVRLSSADEVLPALRWLKDKGYDYLEMISATDWVGPVKSEGYIKNPNPNVFLPEGASPQIVATATPGFTYRPVIDVLWLLSNLETRQRVVLRLEVDRNAAKVPSCYDLFKAADWQEREIYDLMGVEFTGHPNLTKILTPDFLVGHPLRKDYVHVKDKYDE